MKNNKNESIFKYSLDYKLSNYFKRIRNEFKIALGILFYFLITGLIFFTSLLFSKYFELNWDNGNILLWTFALSTLIIIAIGTYAIIKTPEKNKKALLLQIEENFKVIAVFIFIFIGSTLFPLLTKTGINDEYSIYVTFGISALVVILLGIFVTIKSKE